MKLMNVLAAGVMAISFAGASQAATVAAEVFAKENSSKGLVGLATGVILAAGDVFSVSADPLDTWSQGKSTPTVSRMTNADGRTDGKTYKMTGQTFVLGSLVGRIGGGLFFLIGTSYSGVAGIAGQLELFHWDKNIGDNSGSILASITTADISPVPLPAGAPLLVTGLLAAAALRRRKSV